MILINRIMCNII